MPRPDPIHTARVLRLPPWQRVVVTLAAAGGVGLLLLPVWRSEVSVLFLRLTCASLAAMLVFGLFEHWPRTLPRWLARWALQVVSVAVALPGSLFLLYLFGTESGEPPFWQVRDRLGGFLILALTGLLIAPWVALTALVRQKEAIARHQALAFELERSELSRQALDARLRLLQAQIEPHFLFNTLANVRALVVAASPQAPQVLDNLIAYLRAATPRLQRSMTTIGDEVHSARAYLELMHLRMPDRLDFRIDADPAALALPCPPMTLMTPVENAVRHGIDPCEDGGTIEVCVQMADGHCVVTVRDTGVGLTDDDGVGGTGLLSLKERLQLAYGGRAALALSPNRPRGLQVRVDLPLEPR